MYSLLHACLCWNNQPFELNQCILVFFCLCQLFCFLEGDRAMTAVIRETKPLKRTDFRTCSCCHVYLSRLGTYWLLDLITSRYIFCQFPVVLLLVSDHISNSGNAVAFVCSFIHLYPLCLLNWLESASSYYPTTSHQSLWLRLISSYTSHFIFPCQLTTLAIHHSFAFSLQAQNLSVPQILSTLDFLFLPPDWLHGFWPSTVSSEHTRYPFLGRIVYA